MHLPKASESQEPTKATLGVAVIGLGVGEQHARGAVGAPSCRRRQPRLSRLAGQQQQFNERRRRFQASVDKARFEIREAMLEVTGDLAEERKIDIVVSQASTALMTARQHSRIRIWAPCITFKDHADR